MPALQLSDEEKTEVRHPCITIVFQTVLSRLLLYHGTKTTG